MWRKERISGNSTLWEIYGEVLWKSPNPGVTEKIPAVDQKRICGS
jgi:hypothetical protein